MCVNDGDCQHVLLGWLFFPPRRSVGSASEPPFRLLLCVIRVLLTLCFFGNHFAMNASAMFGEVSVVFGWCG